MSYNSSNQYYHQGGRQQQNPQQIPHQLNLYYPSSSGVNGSYCHEPLHRDFWTGADGTLGANGPYRSPVNSMTGVGTHPQPWSAPAPTAAPTNDQSALFYGQPTNASYDNSSNNAFLNMFSYYNAAANTAASNPAKAPATPSTSSNFNYLPSDFDPIAVPCTKSVATDKIGSTTCFPAHKSNSFGYPDETDAGTVPDSAPSSTIFSSEAEPGTTIEIAGLSDKPMTATEIMNKVAARATDVITRYLPCVEFLVICQQDLRRGVEKYQRAPMKQRCTRQFYNTYFHPLPDRFYRKNVGIMPPVHLEAATKEITSLIADAKKVEVLGCENMKVNFLGGMREGQSWGLRQWLSKHGAALPVCNELEMILTALQKLDKESPFTIKLAAQLRKEASYARNRLVKEVPKAYQQFSNAHPFLPFFHRLESALKALANFDPEDDDVIILDDSDVEQEKTKAEKKKSEKQTSVEVRSEKRSLEREDSPRRKRAKQSTDASGSSAEPRKSSECNDDSDDDSVLCVAVKTLDGKEVKLSDSSQDVLSGTRDAFSPSPFFDPAVLFSPQANPAGAGMDDAAYNEIKQLLESEPSQGDWRCTECTFMNKSCSDTCSMCDSVRTTSHATAGSNTASSAKLDAAFDVNYFWDANDDDSAPFPTAANGHATESNKAHHDGNSVVEKLQQMARTVEEFQYSTDHGTPRMDYWDAHWTFVISLFALILREREAHWFLEPVNEEELRALGRPEYRTVVRNPLSFGCIISVLKNSRQPGGNGKLKGTDLHFDVRHGRDLLQAIDLVFLNSLAYNSGKDNAEMRRDTLKLRRMLWDQIRTKAADQSEEIPTKRGETSGFVVVKHSARSR